MHHFFSVITSIFLWFFSYISEIGRSRLFYIKLYYITSIVVIATSNIPVGICSTYASSPSEFGKIFQVGYFYRILPDQYQPIVKFQKSVDFYACKILWKNILLLIKAFNFTGMYIWSGLLGLQSCKPLFNYVMLNSVFFGSNLYDFHQLMMTILYKKKKYSFK